jgi:predicted PolB exonuclease-like 3'-5' exonuclease
MARKYIYLDAETIPDGEMEDFELYKDPPKNFKDPEKIKAWMEEQKEEQFLKQSVDTNRAKLLTIGAAVNEGQPQVFVDLGNYNELNMLKEFELFLKNERETKITEGVNEDRYTFNDLIFVGHNIKKFDLQILFVKAVKYNLPLLGEMVHPARFRYNQNKSYDIMEIWGGADANGYISLDTVANTMGIQGKKGMDGSMVYPKFKEGKIDEIIQYQKDDVILTREVFKRMKNIIGAYD